MDQVAITGKDADGRLRVVHVDVNGNLVISSEGSSVGLTNAELRASDVKVSLDGEIPHVVVDSMPGAGGSLTNTELRASAVPVSLASVPSHAVTGPLTDTQLRATAVPVSGTVSTGGLTDTQLRAVAVPVSGTVTASGPLTDTQLRAVAVPVSGPLTDTQLRAVAVPVSLATAPTTPVTNANLDAALSTLVKESGGNLDTIRNTLNFISTNTEPIDTVQGAIASSVAGLMVQGAAGDSPPSYLNGTVHPLSLTQEGRLRVECNPPSLGSMWETMGNSFGLDNVFGGQDYAW